MSFFGPGLIIGAAFGIGFGVFHVPLWPWAFVFAVVVAFLMRESV